MLLFPTTLHKNAIDATENLDITRLMTDSKLPRIIITTAGFGDGHNSAAYNLATALIEKADPEVIDPCAIGSPLINAET